MKLSLTDLLDKLAANRIHRIFIIVRGNMENRITVRHAEDRLGGVTWNGEQMTFAQFEEKLDYYNRLGSWKVKVEGRAIICKLKDQL